jgi:predicted acyl esterase
MLRNASPGSALTCRLSLIAGLCSATFFNGRTSSAESSEQKYQVFVERDIAIPMRDGLELIAGAYRPAQDGKMVSGQFPVILIRTCYNKDQRPITFFPGPEYFVTRGYAVDIEDTRGRYKSPGHFYHGIYETKDGKKGHRIRVDISSSDYPPTTPIPTQGNHT